MHRRNFIRLAGGGVIAAAVPAALTACAPSAAYPPQAVVAWQGPGPLREPRQRAVAYAITAPNPHNLQPWLVDLREPDTITLFTDPARVLPETDPFGRQILIGHGAFLELLVMALAEQGLAAEVLLWPQGAWGHHLADWDTRPVARIRLRPGGTADPLFAQVLQRHTPKTDFDTQRPVTPETLARLIAATGLEGGPAGQTRHGLRVAGTVDAAALGPLRELCWQSAQAELLTPRTVMESLRLTRVGPEEILRHRDGITLNSPFVRATNAVGLFDRQHPPTPGSEAYKAMMARFEGHSRSAMGFVWLTGTNHRVDQINAGRVYLRLQLQATALGVGMHPMSQALQEFAEMVPHRQQAHRLLLNQPLPQEQGDDTVQMFCRLGYTQAPAPATPRRPVSAIVKT